ncbi:MAG: putative peptidase [Ilumatobacteraceae bacterium]|nr:putative peptidase [Ilumatobacteraceae bacterium]
MFLLVAAALVTAPSVMVEPSAASPLSRTQATAHTYVVKVGDSINKIAVQLQVKPADLLTANHLTTTSVIHPGQTLVVPAGANAYIVVSGDSLARIAGKVGVTVTALLTTNQLQLTSVIHPGETLTIPAGGHPAAASTTTKTTTTKTTTTKTTTTPTTVPATTPGTTTPTTAAPATTPATAAPTTPAPGSTTYTVIAGDYLAGIATRSGVTLPALLAANHLIVTSLILPGMTLTVPPATLPIPAATTPATTPATTTPATTPGTSPATPDAAPTTTVATPTTAATTPTTTSPAYQQSIATLLAFLQAQVGKAYVFNTAGPDTYDCSGLVTAAYLQIGISLPHQSALQSKKGTPVNWTTDPLLPGDLIFQYTTASPTVIGHVGVVIDATHWIQASRPGTPVNIGPIPATSRIAAVRRILQP